MASSGDSVYALKDNRRLYNVLGVCAGASEQEIKRAYHKLAMEFHPDKNPAGAEKFKEISFAYNILSDPEQRQMYDASTLRTHLEKECRDPTMDPNVELEPEQLRMFVERIRNEQRSKEASKQEFERKRRAELERRAEYDRLHPGFEMPPLPANTPIASAFQRTTADIKEALERTECQSRIAATDENAVLGSADPYRGRPGSLKQQMMSEFRQSRSAKGMSTTAHLPECHVNESVLTGEPQYAFLKENKRSYIREANRIRENRGGFDYCQFVVKDYHDGGVIGEAILADALDDYDADN